MTSKFYGRVFTLQDQDATASRLQLDHLDAVKGCCFSPDGNQLLTWSYDGFARLFGHLDCDAERGAGAT